MAGSVIVIDSSPEPELVEPHIQATPILDDDVPDTKIDFQTQGGSSRKDKGKGKAPAPIVYEVSSDGSATTPTHDEDDGEVEFTGMGIHVTTTVPESSEESRKRKREASDSPIGSGLGSGSGSGTASSFTQGSSSSSTVATSSSCLNPTFVSTSTSAFLSASPSGTNPHTNATAGPSGQSYLPSFGSLGPITKKARFETNPVAPRTALTTATPTVQQVQPTGLVVPFGCAAATAAALNEQETGPPALSVNAPAQAPPNAPLIALRNAHPHIYGVIPGGATPHPPGPSYEGALLPPGHFYHDDIPPPAAFYPYANARDGPNYMPLREPVPNQGFAANQARNQVPAYNDNPANQAHNLHAALAARDYNPFPAIAAHHAELNAQLDNDLAAMRNCYQRFPGMLDRLQDGEHDVNAERDRELRVQRRIDEELAQVHEQMRQRLQAAEAQRQLLREAREREGERALERAREREQERLQELERRQERERDVELRMERIRQQREIRENDARAVRARLGLALGGGRAMGLEQGLGLGQGAGGGGDAWGNFVDGIPLFGNDHDHAANFLEDDIHVAANGALGNTLNALNGLNGNANANGGNMDADDGLGAFQNQLDDIEDELGDFGDVLDHIGDGIGDLQDDIANAQWHPDDLDGNAVGNNNENNGGIYANPLFAPPVAAPPAPPVNAPAQNANANMFDVDREIDGDHITELSDGEDDIYVPAHVEIRPPRPNPPGGDATVVAAGPTVVGTTAAKTGAEHVGSVAEPRLVVRPLAGPSTTSAIPATATIIDVDAFQHAPAPAAGTHPPVAGPSSRTGTAASTSTSSAPTRPVDPIDTVLASILEVVPDVLPEHAASLARTHFPSFGVMHTAEHVLGLLFESKDYPKRGKGKGKEKEKDKGKNKGKEETGSVQGDNKEGDGDADFLNAKMKAKPGKTYKRLAIYHLRQSFPHASAAHLATAGSMRYARGHAFLTERLGHVPQIANPHNAHLGVGNDDRAHRHRHRLEEIRAQYYGVPARAGPSRANNPGMGMGMPMPVGDDRHNPLWEREERAALRDVVDKDFAKERRWVERRYGLPKSDIGTGLAAANVEIDGSRADTGVVIGKAKGNGKGKGKAKEVALASVADEPVVEGMGVECQCCFAEYAFSRMAQCPEAHLFCTSCISQYAAVQLGNMNPSLTCMHADGCAMPFGELELRRVLPRKLMRLYERVLSQKAVEGLEGLEACPFCEWKCVMDAPPELDRLFRCGNVRGDADSDEDEDHDDECGVVSCRLCKKLDHTPKSCKEAEEDKHLDGQHAVEEAMTAALMRNCPKCKKAFIKEGGCNKMTCPYCGTHSCYTCRKQITGYDHFDQRPLDPGEPVAPGKCRTHDTRRLEEIHANDVKGAYEKAIAEYKAAHPDADDEQIKVDIPEVPPAPQHNRQNAAGLIGPRRRVAAIMAGGQNIFGNAPWNGVGGAAAAPNIPGWGGAGVAHNPAYPVAQALRNQLAILAAHRAAPRHQIGLPNAIGNAQPAAPAAARPAPPAQPRAPGEIQGPFLRDPHFWYRPAPLQQQRGNAIGHVVGAPPQGQHQQPLQDVIMAEAPPLGNHEQLDRQRRIQEMLDAAAARRRVAVPQPHVPPAPMRPTYPNLFIHRQGAPITQQPFQPQPHPMPAPVAIDPRLHHHHHYHAHRGMLVQPAGANPNPDPDPGVGELGRAIGAHIPFLPIPRRQENAVAGPAYPGIRPGDDRQAALPPARRFVPHPAPAPVPAPAANIPQAGLEPHGVIGMGMGFGAGMEMGMGFGAGMGMGLNMGMHMGAGGGANNVNGPGHLPQGQGAADTGVPQLGTRDADGHYMRPY